MLPERLPNNSVTHLTLPIALHTCGLHTFSLHAFGLQTCDIHVDMHFWSAVHGQPECDAILGLMCVCAGRVAGVWGQDLLH